MRILTMYKLGNSLLLIIPHQENDFFFFFFWGTILVNCESDSTPCIFLLKNQDSLVCFSFDSNSSIGPSNFFFFQNKKKKIKSLTKKKKKQKQLK